MREQSRTVIPDLSCQRMNVQCPRLKINKCHLDSNTRPAFLKTTAIACVAMYSN